MPILQACAVEQGQEHVPTAAKLDFLNPSRTGASRPPVSLFGLLRRRADPTAPRGNRICRGKRRHGVALDRDSRHGELEIASARQRQCGWNVRSVLAGIGRSAHGTSIVRDAAFGRGRSKVAGSVPARRLPTLASHIAQLWSPPHLTSFSNAVLVSLISGMDGTAMATRFATLSRTELWISCRPMELRVRLSRQEACPPDSYTG